MGMKRRARTLSDTDLLRILDELTRVEGLTLQRSGDLQTVVARLVSEIDACRANPIVLYGTHTQAKFANVAAALGGCSIIGEEDAGDWLSSDPTLRRPDFRLLTTKGEQFLVEVKNFRPKDPMVPQRLKVEYLSGLRRYAHAFGLGLKVATYWSNSHMWTLVSASAYEHEGDDCVLPFPRAIKGNEMLLLGDYAIGTVPPLTLKFLTDASKPRSLNPDRTASFTIGQTALLAGGTKIDDPLERRLAWYFMWFGRWATQEGEAEIVDGEVISVEINVVPPVRTPGQEFEVIGYLSEMISRQYDWFTARQGDIERLIPNVQPDRLGIIIPEDYKGKVLQVWQLYFRPNLDDIIADADS